MIKVLMFPRLKSFTSEESGIKRVVETYHKYAGDYGIVFVNCEVEDEEQYDVFAVHAGTTTRWPTRRPIVSHLHGLYWTKDYQASIWEWRANANVVESIRRSTLITVPSRWVAETIQRDARVDPVILPHGIEIDEWVHGFAVHDYVLWNKNRNMDVCSPYPVGVLAEKFPNNKFVTTFAPVNSNYSNVKEIGLKSHQEMKSIIQKSLVYLSTTKETFGIGVLEALASGVPVLGFAHGGNLEIVQHGTSGYLASPGDYDGLCTGLEYCLEHRDILGKNARTTSRGFSWAKPMGILRNTYELAIQKHKDGQRPLSIDPSLYLVTN